MPRFKVDVHGEGLDRARRTLNDAGIPTIGPAETQRHGDPATRRVDNQMSAYIDAATADDAEARVRASLPTDGDHAVEPHERTD